MVFILRSHECKFGEGSASEQKGESTLENKEHFLPEVSLERLSSWIEICSCYISLCLMFQRPALGSCKMYEVKNVVFLHDHKSFPKDNRK